MPKSSVETKESILNYFEAYNVIHSNLLNLRDKNPSARFIQLPKLSAAITESLAHYLIKEHSLISVLDDYLLVGRGDLVYENMQGAKKTLQIKSTGKQAFSKTSQKDLEADYLVRYVRDCQPYRS